MKSTKNHLQGVYAIPEWDIEESSLLMTSHLYEQSEGKLTSKEHYERGGNTQISTQHFLDLIEDKIVEWRLISDEFIGFEDLGEGRRFSNEVFSIILRENENPIVTITVEGSYIPTLCKTYTDLVFIYERIDLK